MKGRMFKSPASGVNQYILVLIVIAIVAVLCRPLSNQQGYYIVSFVLLFVVSVMAIFLGIGPILLASTISALVWNYFFIPPHYVLHIERTEDKLMFVSYFFIALINGVLTNRIRRQETLALEREERTKAIFELTRELANTSGVKEIVEIAFKDIRRYFDVDSLCLLREQDRRIETLFSHGLRSNGPHIDNSVARWVSGNSMKAGRYTEFYSDASLTYYPLTGKRISPGVLAVEFKSVPAGEKEDFWVGYVAQVSNALEREMLSELALKARILDESDKLYKTLFALISHEFRIPIATIMGASDTLLMPQASQPDRELLFTEIAKASGRLNHLVENLLNMSRLESGKISPHLDWCDLNDLLNKVTRILKDELEGHNLTSNIQHDMPPVRVDFGLIEQVLYNLILNSCQYSPSGSSIHFEASHSGHSLTMMISDNGPGFRNDLLDKAFNRFSRGDNSRPGGLGLGLSIVKGLIDAHKGAVKVENLPDGGCRFTITIPSELPDISDLKNES
ncbi:MAG: DUF4118 domain-containing protein [Bacteroidales bacterium]